MKKAIPRHVIKDEILTYSDGYIPHHDVISDTVDRGVHTITIRATVERRRLVSKLRAAKGICGIPE